MIDAWRVQAKIFSRVRDYMYGILSYFGWEGPPSPSRKVVTTQWLSRILDTNIIMLHEEGLGEHRGFVGKVTVLQMETDDDNKLSLILKTSHPQISSRLAGLGGIREAFYYRSKYARHAVELGRIPKIYYSQGSRWLGEMVVLMENLQTGNEEQRHIGVNQLMGNQIWGVSAGIPEHVNKLELLNAMYYHAAEMHAKYWMDKSLLKETWMRNTSWFHGGGRHYWELTMKAAHQGWLQIRTHENLKFPDGFVDVVDASFAKSSWSQLQAHLKTAPFTLTHGDFHAANMLIELQSLSVHSTSADRLLEGIKLFDWSEVGPWEPVTDLAQTVISDLPKELSIG